MMIDHDGIQPRSTEQAEQGTGTPPPERGSPTPLDEESEKGSDDDQDERDSASHHNPLAPPINIGPGS